jgi:hypothetical protein
MVNRRGAGKLGCLVSLLMLAAVIYFGVNVGKHMWTYYVFKDAMQEEAHFAAHRTDAVIKRRLQAKVDSLGLPESAKNIRVKRSGNVILIFTEYYDHVEFPLYVKEIHFTPQVQSIF